MVWQSRAKVESFKA